MRRTAIKPNRLYQLAQEYMAQLPVSPPGLQGGRPRMYDDALILTIASIQNLNQYSFREALEYCEDFFKDLPALSTYHDRLSKFTSNTAQGFIEYIGKKIVKATKNTSSRGRIFIMDGTGFSYHDSYPMKLYRGMEIRKIRTHVKVAALIGLTARRRFVVSAKAGPPYSGDTTLIQPLLNNLASGNGYVLGDKGFDSHRIMETIAKKGYQPVIPIKRGRFGVVAKDPLRIKSEKNSQNRKIYNQRTLIEGLFGNLKQKLSSHVRIFKLRIAEIFALIKFALLNISVLVAIETASMVNGKRGTIWLWFPNGASKY